MKTGWTDHWPSWTSTGWGKATRVLMALTGILGGAFAILMAFFGATFKKYSAEWNLEYISLLVMGGLLALISTWAAIRPTRMSFACLAALLPLWVLLPILF